MTEKRESSISPKELQRKELAALINVRDAAQKYLPVMRGALKTRQTDELFTALEGLGYSIRLREIGGKFRDAKGRITTLKADNPARIGDRQLFIVGTDAQGQIFNFDELVHDAGAAFLGGKLLTQDRIGFIRPETFLAVTESRGFSGYTLQRLNQIGVLAIIKGEPMVADTLLLDAIVWNKDPDLYRMIKYLGS